MEPNRLCSRPNSMKNLLVASGMALILVLGACSSTIEPAGVPTPGPESPVSSTPGDSRTGDGGPLRVTSRINLVDPKPVPWDRYEPLRGGTAIDFYYWSGVEECYGFDHPEVLYEPKRIIVTLFEGRVPDAEVCIELAVRKVVEVALGERLGGRKVIDGAKD